MHFKRIMTLLLAGVIAAYPGGIVSEAADIPSAQAISYINEESKDSFTEESPEYVSEVYKRVLEAKTKPVEFNWKNISESDQEVPIYGKALKLDLSKTSMADDSIDSGCTVQKISSGYRIIMKGKSITRGYGGKLFSGLPTKATVTVYDREKNKVEIPCEVEKTSDKTVDITFEIGDDQMSMKGRKNPFDYDNMIKVQMETSLSDSILGSWVPAMVSPTFFYAFNVGK